MRCKNKVAKMKKTQKVKKVGHKEKGRGEEGRRKERS